MGKIISETPMSLGELKEELDRIKKRDGELNFRANKTEEYLQQINIDVKKSKDIAKKIEELNVPRLRDVHIAKIVGIMPKKVEDLKVVLQGYPISVSNENLKKIVDIINK